MIFGAVFGISSLRMPIGVSVSDVHLEAVETVLDVEKVKISKLAHGLPVGGEIENLDDGTLFSAFKNRSSIASE